MARKEIKVGDRITIGQEIQWWNSDDTNVDYVSDRWAPFEVTEIVSDNGDYVTLEVTLRDGVWEREIELDLDWDDIEFVK